MKSIITNKKAYFEYQILDKYVAGIQLIGTEVKSIKESQVSINEAYCSILNNELFILGMHISDYKKIMHTNHQPVRDRKLLLNRREINKLVKSIKEKGLTIVPLSIFLSDTGMIKVEIGLAKGKKVYDKRESIKAKDLKRDLDRKV
jgi:SsrA-binding protein